MRTKLLPITLFLTTTAFLSGCATNGRATKPPQSIAETVQTKPVVIDTACDWVRAIWVSKSDDMTPGTARQILNHNQAVVKNCGPQKPPKVDSP
ncbi:putative Rz1 protein [Xanthomonas phage vB_Xar_IVIA-DoCa8]|nr:putative Rz1 protein [Xanthomonas phage vB_Xar_IVIA-DoCa8]